MADEVQARTVKGFCAAYGVGRSMAFELIREGKLAAKKMGTRTLIMEASARAWFESLPNRKEVVER